MEEALHDMPLFREFAGLGWDCRVPDESVILRFRHLLEHYKLADEVLAVVNDLLSGRGLLLKAGTVVDATLIAAPSSTKNQDGERDSKMHQSNKGNQLSTPPAISPLGEYSSGDDRRLASTASLDCPSSAGCSARSGAGAHRSCCGRNC
jgi:IS5 family transposase